jgi:putative hydrolase of the HAD superfamily
MRTRPQLVLFDIDGVLCRYDRAAFAGALGELTGHTAEFVREAVWGSGLETRSDLGEVDPEAYLREMSDRLGRPVVCADWLAARRSAMTPDPHVLALVGRVKQRCAIAGLTNNSTMLADHMDVLCPGIAEHLRGLIHTSAALGVTKPLADAYLLCARHHGVRAEQVFFIDDVEANVEGALRAGLQASLFTDVEGLEQALASYGLLR